MITKYFIKETIRWKAEYNLPVIQTKGEHCDQQEIFLNDLQSAPLLCEHQEVHPVSQQLYHHLMPQVEHSL
jgi:hypothetical protein